MVGSQPFRKMQPEMVNKQVSKPKHTWLSKKDVNKQVVLGLGRRTKFYSATHNAISTRVCFGRFKHKLEALPTVCQLHVESAKNHSKRLVMSRNCKFRRVCPHTYT